MGLGVTFILLHLALVISAGESVGWAVVLRGVAANFAAGWLIGKVVERAEPVALKYALYTVVASILALAHAHVAINGSHPDIAHLQLAADRIFLASIATDHVILLRIGTYIIIVLLLVHLANRGKLETRVPKYSQVAITLGAVGIAATLSACDSCQSHRWQASSLFDYNLGAPGADLETPDMKVLDGRTLLAQGEGGRGDRLYARQNANVIVLFVEGLSQHHLEHGYAPELKALSKQGLQVDYFVAHQRQTNRGLYSALCGAYPNLRAHVAKPDLMALGGLQQQCLPKTLREKGYQTAFLQSAPLGYMSKDLFAKRAGFEVVRGDDSFEESAKRGRWGIDDLSLYRGALRYIEEQAKSPFFLTLLTSGTHPPFNTPDSNGDRREAFQYASRSAAWFHRMLEERGLLDNSILVITSDESSAGSLPEVTAPESDNRGFLLVLGADVGNHVNPGAFGQIDIARSILDYLDLPSSGFRGRSFFRHHESARTLYAGNTFRRLLFAYHGQDLYQCSHDFECQFHPGFLSGSGHLQTTNSDAVDASTSPIISAFTKLIAQNDLDTEALHGPLVDLPSSRYEGGAVHQILGRWISAIPPGDRIGVEVQVDNTVAEDAVELQLRWLAFDCREESHATLRAQWPIPAREDDFRLTFEIEQLHPEQCHKAWIGSADQSTTGAWFLERFRVVRRPPVLPQRAVARGYPPPPVPRIAHAGGRHQGLDYTNSIQALNSSYQAGYRLFEIDLSWTSDGQLACVHDWAETFTRLFGVSTSSVPTMEEFLEYDRQLKGLDACNVPKLKAWLDGHPGARIVTDIKQQNLRGLALLSEAMGAHRERLIPQIYHPTEYSAARALGFPDVIWTLYRYPVGDEAVLSIADRLDLFAVTMPRERATSGLGARLQKMGLPTYVHTVNDPARLARYTTELGISEVYTDVLAPDSKSRANESSRPRLP